LRTLPIDLPRSSFRRLSPVAILCGLAALGLLAAVLYLVPTYAPFGLAALGIGVPLVLLVWFRPEFGLLALIFLTSGIILPDSVDVRLPIGGGLDLRDLWLLSMFGILFLRRLVSKTLSIPWKPVGPMLLIFLGFAAVSAAYSLFFQGVEANWVLSDLRDLSFYTVFFLTAWTLRERQQLIILLIGLYLIADVTAASLVLQQFLGAQLHFLASMVFWMIGEQSSSAAFGSVRVVPPGNLLMFYMMSIALCLVVFTKDNRRLRILCILQSVLLGFTLLLTYTRAQWIATVILLGLVSALILKRHRGRLFRYVALGSGALLIALSFGGFFAVELQKVVERNPFLEALVARAGDAFESGDSLEVGTLEWRAFEAEEALHALSKQPLLGVGLGNSYRDVTLLRGEASGYKGSLAKGTYSRFTRFIHSSYVHIATKMGLPAFIVFLGFWAAFLAKSWQLFRKLPQGQLQAIVFAILAGSIGLLVWATIHVELVASNSTAVIGVMAGVVACIHRMHDSESATSPGPQGAGQL